MKITSDNYEKNITKLDTIKIDTLFLAIQLEIMNIEYRHTRLISPIELQNLNISELIGEYGDEFIYGGPNAKIIFSKLAKTIAQMAFVDGGVKLFGYRFEGKLNNNNHVEIGGDK